MFQIFKKPEYKRFNLKPRYWDPEKEKREEREKRIKHELGLEEDSDQHIPHIKGQFRRELQRRKAERSGYNSKYTLRLFMILVGLFMLAFLLFIRNPEGIMRFFGK